MTRIVLASQSTSRRRLLEGAGITPTVIVSNVDEETDFFNAMRLIQDTLRLGDDVVRARLLCALVDVPGVLDVPALTLGVTATELYPQNVVINARALAAFDTSRITVAT